MKKLFWGAMFLALAISVPIPTMAQVSVQIGIPLPPPIVISAPPAVILLPGTGVYVAPDIAVDLFFIDGWYWRPWKGHWYRSRNYRSGWAYYNGVPSFYGRVPSRWREEYREHRWNGREWHYQRLSHQQLRQIWGRKGRKQSRPQPRVGVQHGGPQRPQAVGPQHQGRQPHQEVARPGQARSKQRRSAPQRSKSPRGESGGRR